MKRFRFKWNDITEYETVIEANSKEEAIAKFDNAEIDTIEPTGWVQMEEDSLEVEEMS